MSIKEIFRKITKLTNDQEVAKPKLTPAEVELQHFKRREHLDNVKKELASYRKRNSMLNDNQGYHRSILGKSEHSLFPKPKSKKSNSHLLTSRGDLW